MLCPDCLHGSMRIRLQQHGRPVIVSLQVHRDVFCWLCKKCVCPNCDDTGLPLCLRYALVHFSVFTRSSCKVWHVICH